MVECGSSVSRLRSWSLRRAVGELALANLNAIPDVVEGLRSEGAQAARCKRQIFSRELLKAKGQNANPRRRG